MESKRNGRLLTFSLTVFAISMGVLLALEQVPQAPVIPLRDGRVILQDGAVVIESADARSPTSGLATRASHQVDPG